MHPWIQLPVLSRESDVGGGEGRDQGRSPAASWYATGRCLLRLCLIPRPVAPDISLVQEIAAGRVDLGAFDQRPEGMELVDTESGLS